MCWVAFLAVTPMRPALPHNCAMTATTISRALSMYGHGCSAKYPWIAAIDYAEGEDVYLKLSSRDTGFARSIGVKDTWRYHPFKDELTEICNRACIAAVRSQEPRLSSKVGHTPDSLERDCATAQSLQTFEG